MSLLRRVTGRLTFSVSCASILFLAVYLLGLIWRIDGLDDIPLEAVGTAGVCFVASTAALIVQRLFLAVSARSSRRGSEVIVRAASKFDKDVESYEI